MSFKYYGMSVYTCELCSFYTDRKIKLIAHKNTQKHKNNLQNKLISVIPIHCEQKNKSNSITPPTVPPPTDSGQKNVKYRTLTRQKEKKVVFVPHTPSVDTPQHPSPSVFTLLEIKDNQILSSRRINMTNSTIDFV